MKAPTPVSMKQLEYYFKEHALLAHNTWRDDKDNDFSY